MEGPSDELREAIMRWCYERADEAGSDSQDLVAELQTVVNDAVDLLWDLGAILGGALSRSIDEFFEKHTT